MARLRKGKVTETSEHPESSFSAPTAETNRTVFGVFGMLVKGFVLFLVVGYCIVVFLIYSCYTVRHQAVFLNYLVHPFPNYSDPESSGASNTRNFYIQGEDGRLGIWHVRPKGSSTLDEGKPVFLYMHGNGYSRNAKHRIGLYKVLASLGCHVVALDYRGFGDSDGYPTEKGLIDDSLTAFNWIKTNTNRSPIYLWGHSLGTAVAIGLANNLAERDIPTMGLILEAPFSNMKDAAMGHPISLPFRILPIFQDIIQEINDLFKSDENITSVTCAILILHDLEDKIVGFELGKKLYAAALKSRKDHQSVEFKEFRGYGHKNIFKSKELPEILRTFMDLQTDH